MRADRTCLSSRWLFLVVVAALVFSLGLTVSGCGRRARTGTTGGFDGGRVGGDGGGFDSGPPITMGGVIEEALASTGRLANELCPCAVEQGYSSSVAECLATSIPDAACARSVYAERRSADLDTALRCEITHSDATRSCVTSRGCAAFLDCAGAESTCPTSEALEVYQAAVSDCSGGSIPGACTVRSVGSGTGTGVFSGATSGTSAQSGSCGGSSAPDAVHQWTAPSSGIFTIDTSGSSFDTVLYVRSGACDGDELACNDDAGGTTSEVIVEATTGQQFFIVVDAYSSNMGSYVVNISYGGAP